MHIDFFVLGGIILVLFYIYSLIKRFGRIRAKFKSISHEVQYFGRGYGLVEFKQDHPDCFQNGRVICHTCGSDSIFLRKVGHGHGSILNSHVCRQCGTELYRSKTKALSP